LLTASGKRWQVNTLVNTETLASKGMVSILVSTETGVTDG